MLTISSSSEIDRLFRTGTRAANPVLVVLAKRSEDERGPRGRVAFVAGRSVGSAVRRNRAKRRLREAARSLSGPWSGWDVVLIARPALLGADAPEIERSLAKALNRLGVRHV